MPMLRLSSLAPLAIALALSSCAGGTANIPQTPPGTLPACSVGTQVQLSSPTAGSEGNPTNGGYVQIIVNATTNVLGGQWNAMLLDYAGNFSQGGVFVPVAAGIQHPFANNKFYNATIPTLFPRDVYKVFLNKVTSKCQPALVGAFSTNGG
jgi:hypothetical protein